MIRFTHSLMAVSVLAISACESGTGPYRDIEMQLEIEPTTNVSVGDVVTLRAIGINHGDRTVEFTAGCGSGGYDFEVQAPGGDRWLLRRDLPGLCPITDTNVLEPGETDTLEHSWMVPGPAGTYRVWAGGSVRAGLAARSPVVVLSVE